MSAQNSQSYSPSGIGIFILYYASLYLIKFSVLVFFKRLGQNVRSQNILWWTVFGITAVSWITSFATINYRCTTGAFNQNPGGLFSDIVKIMTDCAKRCALGKPSIAFRAVF